MAWFKRSSRFVILVFLAMALTLASAVNVPAQMPTQSNPSSLGNELAQAFRVPAPPGSSTPDNREGGATRGGCFEFPNNQSAESQDQDNTGPTITALVPASEGQTLAEYATIYWYIPGIKPDQKPEVEIEPEVEITLSDVNQQVVDQHSYPLTKSANGIVGAPGIMSLTMPYPLKIGQKYDWNLTLKCPNRKDPADNSANINVSGSIKRVEPDPTLALRIQQATPQERVALYAKANLWYEMLGSLIELRRDRPYDANLADAWEKLFTAVDLDKIAKQRVFQGATKINNLGLTNGNEIPSF